MRQSVWVLGVAVTLFWGGSSTLQAEGLNVMAPDGALFTASSSTLLWLGAAHGIIEQCDGDVGLLDEKRQAILGAADLARGSGYVDILSGIFDEGQRLGRGMGCNVNQFRLYEEYADLTYESTLEALRAASQ